MNKRIRIGAQLANIAFNWSQHPGRTLSVSDCQMLKNLYKEWDEAPQPEPLKFPTMLRKMWSGSEVQAWLDAHGAVATKEPE